MDLPRALAQTDIDTDNETPKSKKRSSSKRLNLDPDSSSEEDVASKRPSLVLVSTNGTTVLPTPPNPHIDNGPSTSYSHVGGQKSFHQSPILPSPAALPAPSSSNAFGDEPVITPHKTDSFDQGSMNNMTQAGK